MRGLGARYRLVVWVRGVGTRRETTASHCCWWQSQYCAARPPPLVQLSNVTHLTRPPCASTICWLSVSPRYQRHSILTIAEFYNCQKVADKRAHSCTLLFWSPSSRTLSRSLSQPLTASAQGKHVLVWYLDRLAPWLIAEYHVISFQDYHRRNNTCHICSRIKNWAACSLSSFMMLTLLF